MKSRNFEETLTFDDVLLLPRGSRLLPKDADVTTNLTKKIKLNIPIISAAMDTVTESQLAIALAREGGIGIIHRNNTPDAQTNEVSRIKKSESGMIVDPITIGPEGKVYEALELMKRYSISGVPVTRKSKLVGILTNRDLRLKRYDQKKSYNGAGRDHSRGGKGDPAPAQDREAPRGGRRI
jgi:IMP dehydrogenase